jgi:hypothetical protein
MRDIFNNRHKNGVDNKYRGNINTPLDELIVGNKYFINVLGDTDWIAIGATDDEVGAEFTATGTGSGTGKAGTADGFARRLKYLTNSNADNATDSVAYPQFKAWEDGREANTTDDLFMSTIAKFKRYYNDEVINASYKTTVDYFQKPESLTLYSMWEKPTILAHMSIQPEEISSTEVGTNVVLHYSAPHGYINGDRIKLEGFNKSFDALNDTTYTVTKIDNDSIKLVGINLPIGNVVSLTSTTPVDTYHRQDTEHRDGIEVRLQKDIEYVSTGDGVKLSNASLNGGQIENTEYFVKPSPYGDRKRVFLYTDQACTTLLTVDTITWDTDHTINGRLAYLDDGEVHFDRRMTDNELSMINTTAVKSHDDTITFLEANTKYYLKRRYLDLAGLAASVSLTPLGADPVVGTPPAISDASFSAWYQIFDKIETGYLFGVWQYDIYTDIDRTQQVDFSYSNNINVDSLDTGNPLGISINLDDTVVDSTIVTVIGTGKNLRQIEGNKYYTKDDPTKVDTYNLFHDSALTNKFTIDDINASLFPVTDTASIFFNHISNGAYNAEVYRSTVNDEFTANHDIIYTLHKLLVYVIWSYFNSGVNIDDFSEFYTGSLRHDRPFKFLTSDGGDNSLIDSIGFLDDDTIYYMDESNLYSDIDNTNKLQNLGLTEDVKITGNYDATVIGKVGQWTNPVGSAKLFGLGWDGYELIQEVDIVEEFTLSHNIDDLIDAADGKLLVRPVTDKPWFSWSNDINRNDGIHNNSVTIEKGSTSGRYKFSKYSNTLGAPYQSNKGLWLDMMYNIRYDDIGVKTNMPISTSLYDSTNSAHNGYINAPIVLDALEEGKLVKITIKLEYDQVHLNADGYTTDPTTHHYHTLPVYGMKTTSGNTDDSKLVLFDTAAYFTNRQENAKDAFGLHDNGSSFVIEDFVALGHAETYLKTYESNAFHPNYIGEYDEVENITWTTQGAPIPVEYSNYTGQGRQTWTSVSQPDRIVDEVNTTLESMFYYTPVFKSNEKVEFNPIPVPLDTDDINAYIMPSSHVISTTNEELEPIDKLGTPFLFLPQYDAWTSDNIVKYTYTEEQREDAEGNIYKVIDGERGIGALTHALSYDFDEPTTSLGSGDPTTYIQNPPDGLRNTDNDSAVNTRLSIFPVFKTDPAHEERVYNSHWNSLLSFTKVKVDGIEYWLVPAMDSMTGTIEHAPHESNESRNYFLNNIERLRNYYPGVLTSDSRIVSSNFMRNRKAAFIRYFVEGDDELKTHPINYKKYSLLAVTPETTDEYSSFYYENNHQYNVFKMIDAAKNIYGSLQPISHGLTLTPEYINEEVEVKYTEIRDSKGFIELEGDEQIKLDFGVMAKVRSYDSGDTDVLTVATSPDSVDLAPFDVGDVDVEMIYYPATLGETFEIDKPYSISSVELLTPGNKKYQYKDTNNALQNGAKIEDYYWRKKKSWLQAPTEYYGDGGPDNIDPGDIPDIAINLNSSGRITSVTHDNVNDQSHFNSGEDILIPIRVLDDTYVTPTVPSASKEDTWDTEDQWTDQGYDKTKYWPDHVVPSNAEVTINQPSSTTVSQSGTKYVKSAGFTKWEIALDYPPMKKDDFAKFHAVVQAVRGQYTPLYLKFKYNGSNILFNFNQDSSTPKPRIANSYEDDNKVLFVEGFESNEESVFKQGEVILTGQDNGGVQTALHDVNANVFGEAKVRLAYPSDTVKAVGNHIYKDPTHAVVTLAQDSFTYSVDTAGFYHISAKFILDDWK